MKRSIDMEKILAPLSEDNPAGEDLKYTLHDEIKEARREDDLLDQGDWQREVKKADWEKVISLSLHALGEKSKDLQIAAWLTEALTVAEGFEGLQTGLTIINEYIGPLWEHVYPEIEDDDLDYRIGCLEYLNNTVELRIRSVPLTDPRGRAGYSYLQWEESRRVGYEDDASRRDHREELIAEGKIPPEEFDAAVSQSSREFYETLSERLTGCRDEYERLDARVDEKFGNEAPRLAEMRQALENVESLVQKLLKGKQSTAPDTEDLEAAEPASAEEEMADMENVAVLPTTAAGVDFETQEKAVWQQAQQVFQKNGFKPALAQVLAAANTAPSIRTKSRFQLLMAKLCLQAQRPDLALPIVEELNTRIEELNLARWESSQWVAEVLEALYRCLTTEEYNDSSRAAELFRKMCTLDVTKAMLYRHQI
jgi:type VI secretion system protein ImpA